MNREMSLTPDTSACMCALCFHRYHSRQEPVDVDVDG